jgi:hypothetical protein
MGVAAAGSGAQPPRGRVRVGTPRRPRPGRGQHSTAQIREARRAEEDAAEDAAFFSSLRDNDDAAVDEASVALDEATDAVAAAYTKATDAKDVLMTEKLRGQVAEGWMQRLSPNTRKAYDSAFRQAQARGRKNCTACTAGCPLPLPPATPAAFHRRRPGLATA